MASIDLDKIPTKSTLTTNDTLNIEIVRGKFDLSYKTELSKMSRFFMSNNQIDGYKDKIASWVLALERWVFGDGTTYLGFATKDMMDNNYLYLSESNFYYRRLLTDKVMESLCSEYANEKMLSSSLEYCKMKGQYTATELANKLAEIAAIMKSKAIMNDTNIQTNGIKNDGIIKMGASVGEGVAALYGALMAALERCAELEAELAAAESALEAAQAANGYGGGKSFLDKLYGVIGGSVVGTIGGLIIGGPFGGAIGGLIGGLTGGSFKIKKPKWL